MKPLKTLLAQIEVVPGRPRTNLQQMLQIIERARSDGVELVVFPGLALSGLMVGNLWRSPGFLHECEACGVELCRASRGMVLVFGNIAVEWQQRNSDGSIRRYNALFVAEDGHWVERGGGIPSYVAAAGCPAELWSSNWNGGFNSSQQLAATLNLALDQLFKPIATVRAGRLGLLSAPLSWYHSSEELLRQATLLQQAGATSIIIAGPTPFQRGAVQRQDAACREVAQRVQLPLVCINSTGVEDGGKTIHPVAGGSNLYGADGPLLQPLPLFSSGVLHCTIVAGDSKSGRLPLPQYESEIATIARALLYGTERLLTRLKIQRVVIGLSGGIDSALSAALYGRLLPPENLLLISMPGPYTSATTRRLAAEMAQNLGCRFAEIPIDTSVELTRKQFATAGLSQREGLPPLSLEISSYGTENVQARDRGSRILAAAAAAFGGVIACNSNKSELTVGYSTLYGDIIGWLALLGDLWKEDVYALGRYLNTTIYQREVIPTGSFTIVPSAELSAAQNVDAQQGDPLNYPYHDLLFRNWVESAELAPPEQLQLWYEDGSLAGRLGYAANLAALFPDSAAFRHDVEKWWCLYNGLAVAKRLQAPPVMALSSAPLSMRTEGQGFIAG